MNRQMIYALAILMAFSIVTGCNPDKTGSEPTVSPTVSASPAPSLASPLPSVSASSSPDPTITSTPQVSTSPSASPKASSGSTKNGLITVIAKPESITVLANKQNALPADYEPNNLVYPDIPFVFAEKIEKRKMRKVAAEAVEQLFAGAEKEGIHLAGVSAYRSYATQKSIFQRYVLKDGEEKAKTYSAVPRTSEHETGLAIDVTSSNGKCAAEDCFGGTKEAIWLENHAAEYGFIIRYPQGKSAITGYQYEPWHIRYVGTDVSKEIAFKNVTMEEYYNAVPVVK